MLFIKTDKARHELRPGQRHLSQRERAMLLMANGSQTLTDFAPLFGSRNDASVVATGLLDRGYLEVATRVSRPTPMAQAQAEPAAPVPANAADTFDGKRSLATTRMFLFDLCERMFARRDPTQAMQLREALREARDRDTMLAVAEMMIADIEQHAGAERAASIRERIQRILPDALSLH